MTGSDNSAASDDGAFAGTLPTNMLCGLLQEARLRGINPDPWFAGLRVSAAEIQDVRARVSYRQASEIVRRAVRMLPEDIGLELGRRQNGGNFGLLGLAMKTSRDFAQAVAIGLEFQRNQGPLMELRMQHDAGADSVAILAHAPESQQDLLPFLCEEMFASLLMLGRDLAGPGLAPKRVELAYPAPPYQQKYAALFECEVVFNQPRNALLLDRQWLSLQFPSYNPVASQHALAMCRAHQPSDRHDGEYTTAVERYLRRHLRENPTMQEVAAHLHLSERNLRRRLGNEDTRFSAVHDRIRTEQALQMLQNSEDSIAHIGVLVGFNDAREFRRAFKRWTGTTPSQARGR
ncbi:AraC family transcriptional regulator [Pseudoxanthomonas dokdonensis]|uniref:HTH araC/xylS-type domain-containing protein n=1 Tax=Pseudoxanthomonas dokdonensis TaxID=344882 RepID=A0A0R0CU93_9GAMM|nr:AraC family transcriptional regulator [Pseudoxanthomonas dokdonensis]KRG70034.1 hypothetical protein ABB29_07280 [Pseudoxanthomonas dokdonensis]